MVLNYKRSDLVNKEQATKVSNEVISKVSDKKQNEINKLLAKLLFQQDSQ